MINSHSFGLIFWPQSGILAAYAGADGAAQLDNALGLYLFTWVCSLPSPLPSEVDDDWFVDVFACRFSFLVYLQPVVGWCLLLSHLV